MPALSEWATLGTLLLFAIPVVGFILSLVWSFGFGTKPARKRLAQAWLIRTLIVAVVVALLCLMLALTSVARLTVTPYYALLTPTRRHHESIGHHPQPERRGLAAGFHRIGLGPDRTGL